MATAVAVAGTAGAGVGAGTGVASLNARAARAARQRRIQEVRARMRALGLSAYVAAEIIGVTRTTLYRLLEGRTEISTLLGYDRWPETVLARLDAFEDAAIAAYPAVEAAVAAFQTRGLNPPARLVALLALGKPATPSRGKARKTTAATTTMTAPTATTRATPSRQRKGA